MARDYSSGPSGHIITDDDFPGVVGTGRTLVAAEKEFERQRQTTWHPQRVTMVQAILDKILAWNGIERDEYLQLQAMMDDFVGLLREKGIE